MITKERLVDLLQAGKEKALELDEITEVEISNMVIKELKI